MYILAISLKFQNLLYKHLKHFLHSANCTRILRLEFKKERFQEKKKENTLSTKKKSKIQEKKEHTILTKKTRKRKEETIF